MNTISFVALDDGTVNMSLKDLCNVAKNYFVNVFFHW